MAIYTILTETELGDQANKVDFILNNFVDTAKNPKELCLSLMTLAS